jgi:hypothetical protein
MGFPRVYYYCTLIGVLFGLDSKIRRCVEAAWFSVVQCLSHEYNKLFEGMR